MLRTSFASRMVRTRNSAIERTQAISRHMMSTQQSLPEEQCVRFEQRGRLRKYILDRPKKLHALSLEMLQQLGFQVSSWNHSDLCTVIVGTSSTPNTFCSGGDIKVVAALAANRKTQDEAIHYFQTEFGVNYFLHNLLPKSYVAIMDGLTMGGGVGLAAPAAFRVATENTRFAMPETKIGYFPDVGASYWLNELDGCLGRYLSLTSAELTGRSVFELGFATHYIPSSRIPTLLDQLSEATDIEQVATVLEDSSTEREPHDPPTPLTGDIRKALDHSFSSNTVEGIVSRLEEYKSDTDVPPEVNKWAEETVATLAARSPTSLKVALRALIKGKDMRDLKDILNMELGIASAFCRGVTPDFIHGVEQQFSKVRTERDKRAWIPSKLADVTDEFVDNFFGKKTRSIQIPAGPVKKEGTADEDPEGQKGIPSMADFNMATLPTEKTIEGLIRGSHPAAGSTKIQVDEVLSQVGELTRDKLGGQHKVKEVLSRKCRLVDNDDGNFVWLEWIDQ